MVCERGTTKPESLFRENPQGGGSFGRGLRWLGPHSPLRGCSGLAASAPAKIPRRRTPPNFKTGSYDWVLNNVDYIGNLDEQRVTWSRGRDLILSPKPSAGPVNALAKAYVEIDGKPLAEKEGWARKLTFREVKR